MALSLFVNHKARRDLYNYLHQMSVEDRKRSPILDASVPTKRN